MPLSVSNLFVAGEERFFNFVESVNPLNVRKEMENYLHATFQLWAIPGMRKLLDENINLFVFGETYSRRLIIMNHLTKDFSLCC